MFRFQSRHSDLPLPLAASYALAFSYYFGKYIFSHTRSILFREYILQRELWGEKTTVFAEPFNLFLGEHEPLPLFNILIAKSVLHTLEILRIASKSFHSVAAIQSKPTCLFALSTSCLFVLGTKPNSCAPCTVVQFSVLAILKAYSNFPALMQLWQCGMCCIQGWGAATEPSPR